MSSGFPKTRFSWNNFGHNRHINLKQQAEVCYWKKSSEQHESSETSTSPVTVLSCRIGKPRLFCTKCNNHLRVVTQPMHHVNDSDLFHSLFLQNKQSEGAERGRLQEVNPLSFDSRANKNWLKHLNCRHTLVKIAASELIMQRELEFKTDFNQCHIAAPLKDN